MPGFLGYPARRPDWIRILIIGGILNAIPIANIIALGYYMETMKGAVRGETAPPGWANPGRKFVLGAALLGQCIVYLVIPAAAALIMTLKLAPFTTWYLAPRLMKGIGLSFTPADIGMYQPPEPSLLLDPLLLCATAVFLVTGLGVTYLLPMAAVNLAAQRTPEGAFHLPAIWGRVRRAGRPYRNAVSGYFLWFFLICLVMAFGFAAYLIGSVVLFYLSTGYFYHFGELYAQSGESAIRNGG
ncbi:MAG: DUF4013 domain-containing protein [Solirubrobacterales bacterium]